MTVDVLDFFDEAITAKGLGRVGKELTCKLGIALTYCMGQFIVQFLTAFMLEFFSLVFEVFKYLVEHISD